MRQQLLEQTIEESLGLIRILIMINWNCLHSRRLVRWGHAHPGHGRNSHLSLGGPYRS